MIQNGKYAYLTRVTFIYLFILVFMETQTLKSRIPHLSRPVVYFRTYKCIINVILSSPVMNIG